ncbi:MAG: FAD-dependent oxidoreductase [Actinobacteria bacterium]|nr:FAD-dependent oxidoreductase [Actinomycetota bacterium]
MPTKCFRHCSLHWNKGRAMPDFDVIVVGAGPAGSCAALTIARTGKSVALIERGPFPGSKNMYGGVVYPRILDALIPEWWNEMPVQRWVTRRSTMLLTDTQSLSIDFRSDAWGDAPYNGATAFRPDFDNWLANKAVEAGATLVCSTTVTGLITNANGAVIGIHTDRPDGDLTASVVIACDGVNSFLAKEHGMYPHTDAAHFTLGVKETITLSKDIIDERFAVRGNQGVDIEILGGTSGVNGGGFIYTNLDSLSVGVVFSEYSAHLIPEAGLKMMPTLLADGLLVAGDAAAMCLAAGIWLEGVNFAMASGMYAAQAACEAIEKGNTSAKGLSLYKKLLEDTFVLRDHRKLRRAPQLVLSDRVQHMYPALITSVIQGMFHVNNPLPKPGLRKILKDERRRLGIRTIDLAKDAITGFRSFG